MVEKEKEEILTVVNHGIDIGPKKIQF